MEKTISILVRGKVQGVFFRQSTRDKARELGINGEVKNNTDGSVSIIATGSSAALEQLVHWCHQGPERARVDSVQVSEEIARVFSGFQVIR